MWKAYRKRLYPVCRALHQERLRQRMRRDVLAEIIGYHHMTVGRWERGEVRPSLPALIAWCDALEVRLTVETKPPAAC